MGRPHPAAGRIRRIPEPEEFASTRRADDLRGRPRTGTIVSPVNTSSRTIPPSAQPVTGQTTPSDERHILYEIIRTVASSVDLDQVLSAIVRLVTEGTKAHACFIFIVEGSGGRLVLRAAS